MGWGGGHNAIHNTYCVHSTVLDAGLLEQRIPCPQRRANKLTVTNNCCTSSVRDSACARGSVRVHVGVCVHMGSCVYSLCCPDRAEAQERWHTAERATGRGHPVYQGSEHCARGPPIHAPLVRTDRLRVHENRVPL